jgi:uncharacterized protein (TIGR03437 family)
MDPFYLSPTSEQITGYTRCGDSATWTGHCLAAEAFRYKVTGSSEALRNARGALEGLAGLVDVTGTGYFARCRFPASSPFAAGMESEEAPNGVNRNGPWVWIGNTSRDQYLGAMFGLGVAFDLLPELRASIVPLTDRLAGFLVANNFSDPIFILRPDQVLAILQVAAHIHPEIFRSEYESRRGRLAGSVRLPVAFDSLSNSSYFKYNLIYISFFHLIAYEQTPERAEYERAYLIARNATAHHQNAFFNIMDRAIRGPDPARDAETLALLDLWLKRPKRDFYVDLSKQVRVCGDEACDPIPVDLRTPTDFLWQRNPYQLRGGSGGRIGNAGVDYILPYWMARYYGLYGDFTVQSAAAPLEYLAPASLGSLFHEGLEQASELRIRDAGGLEQSASILYRSAKQLNFVVPERIATGRAEFTVLQGSQKALRGIAQIRPVAPALFSMNGTGSGVAAALAIRANGQTQTAVPVFSCGSDNCTAVPLDLAAGGQVYVSLYGTGIRGAGSSGNVLVTVNGIGVPVQYAGAQPAFVGLDQINIALPPLLRGAGTVDVVVQAGGVASNAVKIALR